MRISDWSSDVCSSDLQDTSLLHRSVRDNLLYGRPDASEEEMREAARQANADGFIAELVDSHGRRGYDAHVGERGVKLSGGQRQRSEEHTSELQSLMRISYAVFCLIKHIFLLSPFYFFFFLFFLFFFFFLLFFF